MNPEHHNDYKQLRPIDSEAAKQAVLNYLDSIEENIAQTARVFGINRSAVYDILKKQAIGSLLDIPRTPKHQPRKTSASVEGRVMEAKNKTRLGPIRLSINLAKYKQLHIAPGTIQHFIRRNLHCDLPPKN